jgi:MFS family permease
MPAILRPLLLRDFRLAWIRQSVSSVGDQFYFVALAWLVLQLTGSGLALGSVLIASAVPRGVLMILGGAVTDRASPRSILLLSNLLRAVLVGLLATLVVSHLIQLWDIVAVSVAFGIVDAFASPASSAIVPRLVGPDQLAAANGLTQSSRALSILLGPGRSADCRDR